MGQRKKFPDNKIFIEGCENCPFLNREPTRHCFLFTSTPISFRMDPKPDFCNYIRVDLIEEGGR